MPFCLYRVTLCEMALMLVLDDNSEIYVEDYFSEYPQWN